jgi:hypothetical protein
MAGEKLSKIINNPHSAPSTVTLAVTLPESFLNKNETALPLQGGLRGVGKRQEKAGGRKG